MQERDLFQGPLPLTRLAANGMQTVKEEMMGKAITIAALFMLMGAPAHGETITLLCIWPCSNCDGGQLKQVYKVDVQAHTVNDGQSTYRAAISERYIKWANGHEFQIDRVTGDIFNQSGPSRWNGTCQRANNVI